MCGVPSRDFRLEGSHDFEQVAEGWVPAPEAASEGPAAVPLEERLALAFGVVHPLCLPVLTRGRLHTGGLANKPPTE